MLIMEDSNDEQQKFMCMPFGHAWKNEKYLLINSQQFSQISNVVVEGRLLPIFHLPKLIFIRCLLKSKPKLKLFY